LGLNAQTPVKIATVDIEKVFEKYYKTEAEQARMNELRTKAEEQLAAFSKEREAIVSAAKELQEQSKNPAITADASKKAQADLEAKVGELRAKESEMQTFAQETQQKLQKRGMEFQRTAAEEISKKATEIAKKKGATIVLNSGANAVVVYADASFSITDEVLEQVNKDRPTPAINVTVPTAK
jgi:outer membrane protein